MNDVHCTIGVPRMTTNGVLLWNVRTPQTISPVCRPLLETTIRLIFHRCLKRLQDTSTLVIRPQFEVGLITEYKFIPVSDILGRLWIIPLQMNLSVCSSHWWSSQRTMWARFPFPGPHFNGPCAYWSTSLRMSDDNDESGARNTTLRLIDPHFMLSL